VTPSGARAASDRGRRLIERVPVDVVEPDNGALLGRQLQQCPLQVDVLGEGHRHRRRSIRPGEELAAPVGARTSQRTPHTDGRKPRRATISLTQRGPRAQGYLHRVLDRVGCAVAIPQHGVREGQQPRHLGLQDGWRPRRIARAPSRSRVGELVHGDRLVVHIKCGHAADDLVYKAASGHQYQTPVGRPDFVCIDPSTNALVIVELKRGRPSDKVVGQIARYMGWVRVHLAQPDQAVEGLIVAHETDDQLAYAVSALPGLSLMTYEVKFELKVAAEPAGQLQGGSPPPE
jgi:Endonuclease NucS